MQRKMEVGASCEDLRARCPQFYEVAYKLHEATGDEGMGNFVNNTFRARYKVIFLNGLSSGILVQPSSSCRTVQQCFRSKASIVLVV